jgi:hypothetical protein
MSLAELGAGSGELGQRAKFFSAFISEFPALIKYIIILIKYSTPRAIRQ